MFGPRPVIPAYGSGCQSRGRNTSSSADGFDRQGMVSLKVYLLALAQAVVHVLEYNHNANLHRGKQLSTEQI
eukprot:827640-Amphidinium_carterae.1